MRLVLGITINIRGCSQWEGPNQGSPEGREGEDRLEEMRPIEQVALYNLVHYFREWRGKGLIRVKMLASTRIGKSIRKTCLE